MLWTTYLCAKKVQGREVPFLCVGRVVPQYCILRSRTESYSSIVNLWLEYYLAADKKRFISVPKLSGTQIMKGFMLNLNYNCKLCHHVVDNEIGFVFEEK